MKRRIVFALISVLICVGAVVWLVPYTPMSDTAEIVDVLVLHVHAGDTAEDITGRSIRTPYANCCRKSERAVCRVIIVASAKTAIRFRWYTAVKPYVSASVNRAMRMRSQKVCHRGYISCPAARNSSRCLMNNKREGSA